MKQECERCSIKIPAGGGVKCSCAGVYSQAYVPGNFCEACAIKLPKCRTCPAVGCEICADEAYTNPSKPDPMVFTCVSCSHSAPHLTQTNEGRSEDPQEVTQPQPSPVAPAPPAQRHTPKRPRGHAQAPSRVSTRPKRAPNRWK